MINSRNGLRAVRGNRPTHADKAGQKGQTMEKAFTGTPEQYAEAYRVLIAGGSRTLDELNDANHLALEKKEITLEQFIAAANVLAQEILKK